MRSPVDWPKMTFILTKFISPRVAIVISFLLGYAVIFMPWAYVTIQPIAHTSNNQSSITFIKGRDLPSVDNCVLAKVDWTSSTLKWMFHLRGYFEYMQLFVLIYMWVHFLRKNIKKPAVLWVIFALMSLVLVFVPVFIFWQMDIPEVFCTPVPEILVTGMSLFWPTVLMWLLSIGFGIFALRQASQGRNFTINSEEVA